MLQFIPKSNFLNFVITFVVQLKWALDYLLYNPFFHHRCSSLETDGRPGFIDQLPVRHFEGSEDGHDPTECAVCLCKIGAGDEVRDLRCGHLFHKVCLDRWLGNGHATCPLCRNNLKMQLLVAELRHEVIAFDFVAGGFGGQRSNWWLR